MKALKWLFMEHAPLILRPKIDTAMLYWLVKMLSNCTSGRSATNKTRMLRIADYARISLAAVREETGISYDERMKGTLQLFRTQAQLDACAKDIKALAADGIPYEVLDRDGCIRVEPHTTQGIRLEPSAAAGFAGPEFVVKHPQGREFCERLNIQNHLPQATHVVWTTGGSFVPQEQFEGFLELAAAKF